MCPTQVMCQAPKVAINTNADLVTTLEKSLNTIELCQLQIDALQDCITDYNNTNQQTGE